MQQVSGLARRYARALFRSCDADPAKARKFLSQFDVIKELYSVEMAAKVLKSPVMPKDLKENLLNYALSKVQHDDGITRFVSSIAEAGRIAELPEIISAFALLIDDAEGRFNAEVISAIPLRDDTIAGIKKAIGDSSKVDIKNTVDKGILGGLIFKVGNNILDLSFKTKLNDIANSAL